MRIGSVRRLEILQIPLTCTVAASASLQMLDVEAVAQTTCATGHLEIRMENLVPVKLVQITKVVGGAPLVALHEN